MKILVAVTVIPFVDAADHAIAEHVAAALISRSHQVEVVKLPFVPSWGQMLDQIAAIRLVDVTHTADLLITVGAPTYHLRHPNKVVWLVHQDRIHGWENAPSYDLPGRELQLQIQKHVAAETRASLREASRIFATSERLSARLAAFDELRCQVLPLPQAVDASWDRVAQALIQ